MTLQTKRVLRWKQTQHTVRNFTDEPLEAEIVKEKPSMKNKGHARAGSDQLGLVKCQLPNYVGCLHPNIRIYL